MTLKKARKQDFAIVNFNFRPAQMRYKKLP